MRYAKLMTAITLVLSIVVPALAADDPLWTVRGNGKVPSRWVDSDKMLIAPPGSNTIVEVRCSEEPKTPNRQSTCKLDGSVYTCKFKDSDLRVGEVSIYLIECGKNKFTFKRTTEEMTAAPAASASAAPSASAPVPAAAPSAVPAPTPTPAPTATSEQLAPPAPAPAPTLNLTPQPARDQAQAATGDGQGKGSLAAHNVQLNLLTNGKGTVGGKIALEYKAGDWRNPNKSFALVLQAFGGTITTKNDTFHAPTYETSGTGATEIAWFLGAGPELLIFPSDDGRIQLLFGGALAYMNLSRTGWNYVHDGSKIVALSPEPSGTAAFVGNAEFRYVIVHDKSGHEFNITGAWNPIANLTSQNQQDGMNYEGGLKLRNMFLFGFGGGA